MSNRAPRLKPSRFTLQRLLGALRLPWPQTSVPTGAEVPLRQTEDSAQAAFVDKRVEGRTQIPPVKVRVTDGCLSAAAVIDNISAQGLCLRNLPEQLFCDACRLTVFSSSDPAIPVIHIQPRWSRTDWSGKTMGAFILDTPETWHRYYSRSTARSDS